MIKDALKFLCFPALNRGGNSSYTQSAAQEFGLASDLPAAEDFDGDGKADLAVYRPTTGDRTFRFSYANTRTIAHWGKPVVYLTAKNLASLSRAPRVWSCAAPNFSSKTR
jgi:hypothetical protein